MKKSKKDKDFIHKPYYLGGNDALKAFIISELRYPEEAKKNKIQGTVKLAFEIDYKGFVDNVKVISGIGYGCDEEAIRLASLLTYEVPKTYRLRIGFKKKLNIHFRLKKEQKEISSKNPKSAQHTYSYTIKQSPNSEPGSRKSGYTYTIQLKEN